MPRVTTALFTGTILIVVLCQAFARQVRFSPSAASSDLLFALVLIFCTAGILTCWLGKPVKHKPEDDSDTDNGNNQKPPHDTAL